MPSVKGRATLRAEQAALTRRRILDAAAAVFVEQGFAGARIEDIAQRAGVAVPTVYKVFTNKPNLLVGALNHTMAGGDEPIDQQAWFTEQLKEPDPARQLELVARNARRLYERSGGLLRVLSAAAPREAKLAAAWDEIAAQRLERSRRTARSLRAKAGDRARLGQDDTAMTLTTLTDVALFTTFVAAKPRAAHYEAWLSDALRRVLLD